MMNEMERLQAIMQKEELNARDFAAEVGISPATMSNIVNGRNKPSLEVMQKVLNRFRSLRSDWLILGTGSMYRMSSEATEQTLFDIRPEEDASAAPAPVIPQQTEEKSKKTAVQVVERQVMVEKKVKKVVVFFDDGTFQEL